MKNQTKYIDGFVLVVPKAKVDEYRQMAEMGKEMWKKYGALDYKECLGDDLEPKEMGGMKAKSFLELAGASGEETVWFSFIVYKSKEHRDEVNAKVMKAMAEDASMAEMTMPFDLKRMAVGGFEVVVDA